MLLYDEQASYKSGLYQTYLSNHIAIARSVSSETLAYDLPLFRRTVQPYLPTDKKAPILDLGCGYGGLVYCISRLGYAQVRGVDLSAEMVDLARTLGIAGVHQGDFVHVLRENSSTYALITALDVIEHQRREDVLGILNLIFQALRPGGALLIQTPNAMSHYGLCCRYGDFTHEIIFDGQSIRQVMSAAGFVNLNVTSVPPCVRGPLSAVRRLYWAFREPWLKLTFALEAGWLPGQVFTPNLLAVGYKPAV
jgi:2-polyprenyl-3-methyl-5-hydroxy-6-metoxy-1,4-benzoquinol methylase